MKTNKNDLNNTDFLIKLSQLSDQEMQTITGGKKKYNWNNVWECGQGMAGYIGSITGKSGIGYCKP